MLSISDLWRTSVSGTLSRHLMLSSLLRHLIWKALSCFACRLYTVHVHLIMGFWCHDESMGNLHIWALRQVSLHVMATTLAISKNCISLVVIHGYLLVFLVTLSAHFVCPWQKRNFDKNVHHKAMTPVLKYWWHYCCLHCKLRLILVWSPTMPKSIVFTVHMSLCINSSL